MRNQRFLALALIIFINIVAVLYVIMNLYSLKVTPLMWVPTDLQNISFSFVDIGKQPSMIPLAAQPTNSSNRKGSLNNEDHLSDLTLHRLRVLLNCKDKEFLPRTMQRGEFIVLENFVRAEHGLIQCHESVTYTTNSDYRYLDNLLEVVKRWPHPVSVSVYAPGTDFLATLDSIRYLRDCAGDDRIKQYVTFHIFFSPKHMPSQIPSSEQFLQSVYVCPYLPPYANVTTTFKKKHGLLYPVNVARNIARDATLTHFMLVVDIELYPSINIVPRFLNMIARNAVPLNTSKNPRVFPLTPFEIDASVQAPLTKSLLLELLAQEKAQVFHTFVCKNCHKTPKAKQWIKAKDTNSMDVFTVGKRYGEFKQWEPMYIGTNLEPYYDERLSWDGKMDRILQGYILCLKNYDFMILNNAFLVHKPGINKNIKEHERNKIVDRQYNYIFKAIGPELAKLYGSRPGCKI